MKGDNAAVISNDLEKSIQLKPLTFKDFVVISKFNGQLKAKNL